MTFNNFINLNIFDSQRLVFEEKNETLLLENALSLTHGFLKIIVKIVIHFRKKQYFLEK